MNSTSELFTLYIGTSLTKFLQWDFATANLPVSLAALDSVTKLEATKAATQSRLPWELMDALPPSYLCVMRMALKNMKLKTERKCGIYLTRN